MVYLLKMVIFHCYVSSPEGNLQITQVIFHTQRLEGRDRHVPNGEADGVLLAAKSHRKYTEQPWKLVWFVWGKKTKTYDHINGGFNICFIILICF